MRYSEKSGRPRLRFCPNWLLSVYIRIRALPETLLDGRGQDLVEYALVASLISLAAIVGMKSAATAIGTAYNSIGTKFAGFVS